MSDFSNIYDVYAKQVFCFALKLTNNREISEELTQDTFYKAFLNIDKFEGKCSMYTWLCQIAKNIYFSNCKRYQKIKNKEIERADTEDFVKAIIDKEQVKAVHKALHCIPEPYKEVFTLKVFGELTFKDIAELFDKSESWAKMTYYRAKEKIVTEMEDQK